MRKVVGRGRSGAGLLACAWAGIVGYGSLIPFDVDFARLTRDWRGAASAIRFRSTDVEDAIVNVAVYALLGAAGVAWMAGGSRSRVRRTLAAAGVVLLSAGMSTFLEAAQTLMRSRVASWTDVGLNTAGAGLGALVAIGFGGRLARSAERGWGRLVSRPMATAAAALTVGLFAYHLAPFDFVRSTAELHAGFARARAAPEIGWSASKMMTGLWLSIGAWQAAGWFALLGYVLSRASRERGRLAGESFVFAVKHGAGLAGLIECMQLLTNSHVFDGGSILLRGGCAAIGAWTAMFLGEEREGADRGLRIPTWHVAAALAFQAVLVLWPGVAGAAEAAGGRPAKAGSIGIPLESLWRAPAGTAAMSLASKGIAFGALYLSSWMLLSRRRSGTSAARGAWWCAAAVVVVNEALRFFPGGRTPDWGMVAAAAGVGAMARAVHAGRARNGE